MIYIIYIIYIINNTALRWFVSDTAHIVFIHLPSLVKPVHIFMAKNRVSKSCLIIVKLLSSISIVFCILIVFQYIFLAFTTSSGLAIRKTSLL